ncbi:hypothetical protein GCM10010343_39500 [Streptomyces avidinii]|nr:hypothetical protein GCM10010343_39500 [Streptomyces avidinii]
MSASVTWAVPAKSAGCAGVVVAPPGSVAVAEASAEDPTGDGWEAVSAAPVAELEQEVRARTAVRAAVAVAVPKAERRIWSPGVTIDSGSLQCAGDAIHNHCAYVPV